MPLNCALTENKGEIENDINMDEVIINVEKHAEEVEKRRKAKNEERNKEQANRRPRFNRNSEKRYIGKKGEEKAEEAKPDTETEVKEEAPAKEEPVKEEAPKRRGRPKKTDEVKVEEEAK